MRTPSDRLRGFLQDVAIGLVIGTALYWLVIKPISLWVGA